MQYCNLRRISRARRPICHRHVPPPPSPPSPWGGTGEVGGGPELNDVRGRDVVRRKSLYSFLSIYRSVGSRLDDYGATSCRYTTSTVLLTTLAAGKIDIFPSHSTKPPPAEHSLRNHSAAFAGFKFFITTAALCSFFLFVSCRSYLWFSKFFRLVV